ncbi:MAG: alcohol dehydrogenase catalytic domain-containing protein [Pseudonocardiaceae bacterium]
MTSMRAAKVPYDTETGNPLHAIRAVQVAAPGGSFEIVEKPLPEPGPGEVRVVVEAAGTCQGDSWVVHGALPGIPYPIVPGHEVAGRIDAVGPEVTGWEAGQRVGVGWYGGDCGHCAPCRRGDLVDCRRPQTTTGGWADAMLAPARSLASIPDQLSAVEAAPLMCAGVTAFNALRNSGARAGDLVAVLGLGGVGHLGVQFAAKLGFDTVAVSRGRDKEDLARQLGARHYVDSREQDVAQALAELGGARVVLATATNSAAMSATIDGLAARGQLIVVGVSSDPIEVTPAQLIQGSRSIVGHTAGTALDSEETLAFSALSGIRPMIEILPLEDAATAYQRMLSGQARFRMVLTTGN